MSLLHRSIKRGNHAIVGLYARSIVSVRQRYGESRTQEFNLDIKSSQLPIEKVIMKRSLKEKLLHKIEEQVAYFLPKGYPVTVREGYARFAVGQSCASILGSIGGILSTQSMLMAIGMHAGTIPLAATLNWIVKDGVGQFGGVVFASYVSNRFDADPKMWRMVAAVSMEVSSFMELLTPLAPAYFLPIASVANVGKNISYLAASASRAAIHKSFAMQENLADVTAKTGSQSVMTGMIGTALGVSVAAMIGDHYSHTVMAFICCSSAGLLCTYHSLSHVTINTLSLSRLECLLSDYFKDCHIGSSSVLSGSDYSIHHKGSSSSSGSRSSGSSSGNSSSVSQRSILTPTNLRDIEFCLMTPKIRLPVLLVGSDIDTAIRSQEELQTLQNIFANEKYIISVLTTLDHSSTTRHAETHILFLEGAKLHDITMGLTVAYFARLLLLQEGYGAEHETPISTVDKLISNVKRFTSSSDSKVKIAGSTDSLVLRVDILERAKATADSDIGTTSVSGEVSSLAREFADKLLTEQQWLVASGMLETRFARVSFTPEDATTSAAAPEESK